MRIPQCLLVLACVLLGGCNAVIADHPLFVEADRSTTLVLEDGLWYRVDSECEVDLSKPRASWPNCADWMIFKDSKAIKSSDVKADEETEDLMLVDGNPPLIQARVRTNGSATVYGFLALEPIKRSASGKLILVDVWAVPCGTQEAGAGPSAKITPYPGISEECRTDSSEAVRAAAPKGRKSDEDLVRWQWVRAEAP